MGLQLLAASRRVGRAALSCRHVSIRATNLIAEGSEIIVAEVQSHNTLGYLLQFDGSFKSETMAGGAGFCIYRVLPG